jgi:hypothetical protein
MCASGGHELLPSTRSEDSDVPTFLFCRILFSFRSMRTAAEMSSDRVHVQ